MGWDGKFDLQILSQQGSIEMAGMALRYFSHVVRMLGNQEGEKQTNDADILALLLTHHVRYGIRGYKDEGPQ